ncbi:hypothetical protein AMBR_CKHPCMOK_02860 [Lacticaseibacillus rhamnosus]|nr:hypothetical protein AMBR_CKHPCMOK_02860 [Lacticaseibacillus rhamnosus]
MAKVTDRIRQRFQAGIFQLEAPGQKGLNSCLQTRIKRAHGTGGFGSVSYTHLTLPTKA